MNENFTGLLVAAVGVVAVLIDVFSKPLGLSHGSFGGKHIILLIVGIALIVGGLVMARRATARRYSTRY